MGVLVTDSIMPEASDTPSNTPHDKREIRVSSAYEVWKDCELRKLLHHRIRLQTTADAAGSNAGGIIKRLWLFNKHGRI